MLPQGRKMMKNRKSSTSFKFDMFIFIISVLIHCFVWSSAGPVNYPCVHWMWSGWALYLSAQPWSACVHFHPAPGDPPLTRSPSLLTCHECGRCHLCVTRCGWVRHGPLCVTDCLHHSLTQECQPAQISLTLWSFQSHSWANGTAIIARLRCPQAS